MNTVEAASSLFGTDESLSDPFASLGDEQPGPVNDFFAQTGPQEPEYAPDTQEPRALSNTWNVSNYAPSASSGGAYNSPQTTQGTHMNANANTTMGYTQTASGSYQPATTNSYYDPLAPANNVFSNSQQQPAAYAMYTPAMPSISTHTSHNPTSTVTSHAPYNTYAPLAHASQATNAYSPPISNPYAPSTHQLNGAISPSTNLPSTFTVPPQASYSSSYATTPVPNAVPPPPKPAAPLTRPKPNAYDPPFPSQSNRRNQRQVTPYNLLPSLYGNNQTSPPPPIPPPPPPRTPQGLPRQASPGSNTVRQGSAMIQADGTRNVPSHEIAHVRTAENTAPETGKAVPAYQSAYASGHVARPNSRQYDRYTPSPLSQSRPIVSQLAESHAPAIPSVNDPHTFNRNLAEDEHTEQSVDLADTTIHAGDYIDIATSKRPEGHLAEMNEVDVEGEVLFPSASDDLQLHALQDEPHDAASQTSHQDLAPITRTESPPTARYSPVVDRAPSPSSRSVRSFNSYIPIIRDTYSPKPATSANGYELQRTASPGAASIRSNGSHTAKPSRYTPSVDTRNRSLSNGSAVSAASPSSTHDSYAPANHARRQTSESSDYGDYPSQFGYTTPLQPQSSAYTPHSRKSLSQSAQSSYIPSQITHPSSYTPSEPSQSPYASVTASQPYNQPPYASSSPPSTTSAYNPQQVFLPPTRSSSLYQPPQPTFAQSAPPPFSHDAPPSAQELTVSSSLNALYAPSPSLLGSNDPLGRTTARAPVFSFGFGGRLVTCFHGASALDTGFDVALTSRKSTAISIQALNKLIPESALSTSSAVFPGPLFSDPGTPTSIVRTGLQSQSSHTKAKKARVLKYLEEREEEISAGIPYLHTGSAEQGKVEGKLALVRMLKVIIEHDGRLSGTPEIDMAVRAVLVPRVKDAAATSCASFTSVADLHGVGSGFPINSDKSSATASADAVVANTVVRASALEKIQEFLVRGERRQAYHFALDEKMWSHAMVIASSIDKEAWKEAVSEFLKTELGPEGEGPSNTMVPQSKPDPSAAVVNGREGLRVAYSLYAGSGAAAVHELVPHNILSKAMFPPVTMNHMTPGTPNFPSVATSAAIPLATLLKWNETAAMMYSNPLGSETSGALTSLGDHLAANGWTEAAHTCYLLSLQTSPFGGVGNPASRIVLLGSPSPNTNPNFHTDHDPIIFSEVVEFALSLTPPVKGHEPFTGLPHLQPYRLVRAISLAEAGNVQLSKRYCDAISASLGRGSPYFNTVFLEQLKGLTDRIVAAPQLDKSTSWIPGKMSKPSLDTIGGWLEGRITKLIAGDGEDTEVEGIGQKTDKIDGPFAHYSTISSSAPSTSPSPAPSLSEMQAVPSTLPSGLRRSGSVSSYQSALNVNVPPPTGRSSSAIDFAGRKASPGPRIASAGPGTTTFSQSQSSFSQAMEGMHYSYPYSPIQEMLTPKPTVEDDNETNGQDASWWGQTSYADNNFATPTATTFMRVDQGAVAADAEGFISMMDVSHTVSASSSTAVSRTHSSSVQDDDEIEDLGFSNSKSKLKAMEGEGKEVRDITPAKVEPSQTPRRPDLKPADGESGGSWFGRWWKRGEGPIKANLGEERSIYYDPELKKWVNKNAAADTSKPATPPPPPSRAQTASPGGAPPVNGSNIQPRSSPPVRAASAMDVGSFAPPPAKSTIRVRSNLVPSGVDSAPSTPTGLSTNLGPSKPPDRPRSQAAKRNVRSRYVDVFQETK